ncbi:MAG TPA: hypothetical protein VLR94_08135, partial [Acidobacteriota bacterium]|nr:hypothetical protein [Acidobacteriota bacterium]
MLSRREFLAITARCGPAFYSAGFLHEFSGLLDAADLSPEELKKQALMQTAPVARYWVSVSTAGACLQCHGADEKLEGKKPNHQKQVRCQLCAQNCIIAVGERGQCRARMNV